MTDRSTPGTPLTERELDILARSARGLSNAEIGRELYLAMDTVKAHQFRINSKLGARNRTHALVLAFSQGLLRLAHDGHTVSAQAVESDRYLADHHDLRCPIWTAERVTPHTCQCRDEQGRTVAEPAALRDRAVAEWSHLTPFQRATRIDDLAGQGA